MTAAGTPAPVRRLQIGWIVDAQEDFLSPPDHGGRLYVHDLLDPTAPGAQRIVPALARTARALQERVDLLVYTGDWHGAEDAEIDAVAPDPSRGTYPPHCMGRSLDPAEAQGAALVAGVAPAAPFTTVLPWNVTGARAAAVADTLRLAIVAYRATQHQTTTDDARPTPPTLFVQKTAFNPFTGNPGLEAFLTALGAPQSASPSSAPMVTFCGVATDVCVAEAIEGFQERFPTWALALVTDAVAGLGLRSDAACFAAWAQRGVVLLPTLEPSSVSVPTVPPPTSLCPGRR